MVQDTKAVTPKNKHQPEQSDEIVSEQKFVSEKRSVVEVEKSILEKEDANKIQTELSPPEPVGEPALTATPTAVLPASTQDRLEKEIEEILEEDLQDLYAGMSKDKQIEFKQKGEQPRSLIRQLVQSLHINTKKIFHLIRAWLKMIPGVNRFFLEQAAKIKTDKVLLVTEEEKRRGLK